MASGWWLVVGMNHQVPIANHRPLTTNHQPPTTSYTMTKRGRPPVLDSGKKREILAMLTVGCSRRTAARYVGCAAATIQNTAERDPQFAEQLHHADHLAEIEYLKNIRKAAKKEQGLRAAAWALERLNPEDFALRAPRQADGRGSASLAWPAHRHCARRSARGRIPQGGTQAASAVAGQNRIDLRNPLGKRRP